MTKLLMKTKSCLNKLFRHQYLLQSLSNVTQIQGQTQIQAQIQRQSKAGPIPTRCSYISADYNPCPPPILANCHGNKYNYYLDKKWCTTSTTTVLGMVMYIVELVILLSGQIVMFSQQLYYCPSKQSYNQFYYYYPGKAATSFFRPAIRRSESEYRQCRQAEPLQFLVRFQDFHRCHSVPGTLAATHSGPSTPCPHFGQKPNKNK